MFSYELKNVSRGSKGSADLLPQIQQHGAVSADCCHTERRQAHRKRHETVQLAEHRLIALKCDKINGRGNENELAP